MKAVDWKQTRRLRRELARLEHEAAELNREREEADRVAERGLVLKMARAKHLKMLVAKLSG